MGHPTPNIPKQKKEEIYLNYNDSQKQETENLNKNDIQ